MICGPQHNFHDLANDEELSSSIVLSMTQTGEKAFKTLKISGRLPKSIIIKVGLTQRINISSA